MRPSLLSSSFVTRAAFAQIPAVLASAAMVALFGSSAACGGSSSVPAGDDTPYTSDPDKTVLVGGAEASGSAAQSGSSGCVTLPSGECVDAKQCAAGERRDVIVDSADKVVAVVCYPASSEPPVVDAQGNVSLDKNQNNGVVAVDDKADGVDVTGNVTASGNNVTVYGHGAGVSVIGGDVSATGNNFSMRGVTVQGNVEIGGGNNAALVLCVILGNVHIVGNNNVIANCDVLGNIVIEGVNNVLVGNHVGGTITISDAKNQVCDGNTKWTDANANRAFDPGEAGAALTCTTSTAANK
jgi:hypothetical protein